ncbi:MAG: PDZ domain-containing protein [Planctomycetota bacterium]
MAGVLLFGLTHGVRGYGQDGAASGGPANRGTTENRGDEEGRADRGRGIPRWLRYQMGRVSQRRDNAAMRRLVAPISESTRGAVVHVMCGGRAVALGTIVGSDGYVVTKHSELTNDPIRVRLDDGRTLAGRLAANRRVCDLALIKIESEETFSKLSFVDRTPEVGSFLISPGRTGRTIGIGVVGTGRIRVEPNGRLGVHLQDNERQGASISFIQPGSGAELAGIEKGDQIVAVNGLQQNDPRQVKDELHKQFPGETVRLTIVRDGSMLELNATIQDLSLMQESPNDAKVNGPRNARLSGFDEVIQHDTVLEPGLCGGPILDTDGTAIGLNIARAGRVNSYALPASLMIRELVSMLNEARN